MTDEMKGLVDKAASALKAVGAKEVYVFGSASKGKMRPNSDVDMAVSGLPPEVFFRAMAAAMMPWGALWTWLIWTTITTSRAT